jgi:hypothetical protein
MFEGRNASQFSTGCRGYFTGSAVHMTKTDRAPLIGRWLAHFQQRLSGYIRSRSAAGTFSGVAGDRTTPRQSAQSMTFPHVTSPMAIALPLGEKATETG